MSELQVEATGETVGEAKWAALRELERLNPAVDKASVRFEVVTEGERGLLGVGYAPARVIATAEAQSGELPTSPGPREETDLASDVRFGGGAGFGARRRVTRPCPTVHRFVVIQ